MTEIDTIICIISGVGVRAGKTTDIQIIRTGIRELAHFEIKIEDEPQCLRIHGLCSLQNIISTRDILYEYHNTPNIMK